MLCIAMVFWMECERLLISADVGFWCTLCDAGFR